MNNQWLGLNKTSPSIISFSISFNITKQMLKKHSTHHTPAPPHHKACWVPYRASPRLCRLWWGARLAPAYPCLALPHWNFFFVILKHFEEKKFRTSRCQIWCHFTPKIGGKKIHWWGARPVLAYPCLGLPRWNQGFTYIWNIWIYVYYIWNIYIYFKYMKHIWKYELSGVTI